MTVNSNNWFFVTLRMPILQYNNQHILKLEEVTVSEAESSGSKLMPSSITNMSISRLSFFPRLRQVIGMASR